MSSGGDDGGGGGGYGGGSGDDEDDGGSGGALQHQKPKQRRAKECEEALFPRSRARRRTRQPSPLEGAWVKKRPIHSHHARSVGGVKKPPLPLPKPWPLPHL